MRFYKIGHQYINQVVISRRKRRARCLTARPPRFLDEMVAAPSGDFLRSRGYVVQQVRDVFALGTDDQVIAAGVNNQAGIIVTWDKDFRNISKRLLHDGTPKFPNKVNK